MKFQIKSRFTGSILFETDISVEFESKSSAEKLGAAVKDAYLQGADLRGAYLQGAKLTGKRPVFQMGPLGSRGDYLLAFLTNQGIKITAGCFSNTLEAFKVAVIETHGDSIHAREYAAAIIMIEAYFSAWPAGENDQAPEIKNAEA